MKRSTLFAIALVVALSLIGAALTQPPGGPPPGRRPGGPPPGPGPRGVAADDLIERVLACDKNKDGKVTKDELPERLQYLLERGDTNKDGALDREELKALAAQLERPRPPRGPGGPPAVGGPPPLDRVLDELKLSDKQKDKADAVLRAHHERMRKLHEQARQELLKQMKDILTPEQFQEFEKALPERPMGPPPGRRPPPPE